MNITVPPNLQSYEVESIERKENVFEIKMRDARFFKCRYSLGDFDESDDYNYFKNTNSYDEFINAATSAGLRDGLCVALLTYIFYYLAPDADYTPDEKFTDEWRSKFLEDHPKYKNKKYNYHDDENKESTYIKTQENQENRIMVVPDLSIIVTIPQLLKNPEVGTICISGIVKNIGDTYRLIKRMWVRCTKCFAMSEPTKFETPTDWKLAHEYTYHPYKCPKCYNSNAIEVIEDLEGFAYDLTIEDESSKRTLEIIRANNFEIKAGDPAIIRGQFDLSNFIFKCHNIWLNKPVTNAEEVVIKLAKEKCKNEAPNSITFIQLMKEIHQENESLKECPIFYNKGKLDYSTSSNRKMRNLSISLTKCRPNEEGMIVKIERSNPVRYQWIPQPNVMLANENVNEENKIIVGKELTDSMKELPTTEKENENEGIVSHTT